MTMGIIRKKAATPPVHVPEDDTLVQRLVTTLLDFGLDGSGPLPSAAALGHKSFLATGDREKAIARVARRGLVKTGITGFATGLGGFFTMPLALPTNVAAFYLQATRTVGAIAHLRGHDINDPAVRTAILLTLVGADATDVLRKAGVKSPSGAVTGYALKGLPPAGLMMVNKAIGFQLVRGLGEKSLASLGRGVPFAGGALGATLDTFMMKTIATHAMNEFELRQPVISDRTVPGEVPGTVMGSVEA